MGPPGLPYEASVRNAQRKTRRNDEKLARRVSVAIACAALALLVLASMFAAVRAWIRPEAGSETAAAGTDEPLREGRVIYRRPDDTSCLHKSFNNESGKLSKPMPGPCDSSNPRSKRQDAAPGFSWGGK